MRRNVMMLVIVVAVIAFFYYVASLNKSFFWEETYSHTDDQPFGCQWFDSIAATTMPKGFTYYEGDFETLMKSKGKKALLVINTEFFWDSLAIASLDSFVRAGNKLMLVSKNYSTHHNNWLQFEEKTFSYFSTINLAETLKGETPKDTIVWKGDRPLRVPLCQGFIGCFAKRRSDVYTVTATVTVNKGRIPMEFEVDEEDAEDEAEEDVVEVTEEKAEEDDVEATKEMVGVVDSLEYGWATDSIEDKHVLELVDTVGAYGKIELPVSMYRQLGKGQLYIVMTPILFTNYGALDPYISQYLNRQLSQIADMPVVRVNSKILSGWNRINTDSMKTTPLRFMLSQKPLKWALYTILTAVLIFIIFTARRRQRIIPVIAKPVNRNLDFARLIGSIYCRRHDNLDLIKKKYVYFKEDLRRVLMIDLDDQSGRDSHVRQIAALTEFDEQHISDLISEIQQIISADERVSDKDTIRLIRQMNNLISSLLFLHPHEPHQSQ